MDENLVPGTIYRHFKNKLYQIVTVAKHSETGQELVIYQALYDDFGVYARPKDMFLSEVDHKKYPLAKQKYRFEKVDMKDSLSRLGIDKNDVIKNAEHKTKIDEEQHNGQHEEEEIFNDDASRVNPDLMDFLNAEEYKEKIEVLSRARKRLDERVLDSMAASIDHVLPDGDLDVKFSALMQNLKTLERYELKRR